MWYFTSPRPMNFRRVHRAVELAEDLIRALAQDVGQHVQPAAVGHADDDLLQPQLAAQLEHGVQHREQRLAAVHAEALGAHVLGVEEGLEGVGVGQLLEDAPLLAGLGFSRFSVCSIRGISQRRRRRVVAAVMYSTPRCPQ